jgi:protein-disulfide isomerase
VRSIERRWRGAGGWNTRLSLVSSLSIGVLLLLGVLVGCSTPEATPTNTPVPPADTPTLAPDPDTTTTPEATTEPLVPLDDDPVLGSPDAPVTIIEYSEYLCSYCRAFALETLPLIKEQYIDTGQVKLIFRDFPVHGEGSVAMAMVAECAADQDRFWEMNEVLFDRVEEWSASEDLLDTVVGYADELGVDTDVYYTCLQEGATIERIREDYLIGVQEGVNATPTFFVNGTLVRGAVPFEDFQTVIEDELAKSG